MAFSSEQRIRPTVKRSTASVKTLFNRLRHPRTRRKRRRAADEDLHCHLSDSTVDDINRTTCRSMVAAAHCTNIITTSDANPPLLRLPAELRNHIASLVLINRDEAGEPEPFSIQTLLDRKLDFLRATTLCKQIRTEWWPYFWGQNAFLLEQRDDITRWFDGTRWIYKSDDYAASTGMNIARCAESIFDPIFAVSRSIIIPPSMIRPLIRSLRIDVPIRPGGSTGRGGRANLEGPWMNGLRALKMVGFIGLEKLHVHFKGHTLTKMERKAVTEECKAVELKGLAKEMDITWSVSVWGI